MSPAKVELRTRPESAAPTKQESGPGLSLVLRARAAALHLLIIPARARLLRDGVSRHHVARIIALFARVHRGDFCALRAYREVRNELFRWCAIRRTRKQSWRSRRNNRLFGGRMNPTISRERGFKYLRSD